MTKIEFMSELRQKLSGLPKQDVDECLGFYGEMIDCRIDEGLSEEDAVGAMDSVDEIAAQIIADIPLRKIAKERIKPKRRLKAWEIVLLVLGSPVWLPLVAAALVVILAVYAVIWSVIASLWAVFAALGVCAVAGVAIGILFIVMGNVFTGIALIGVGIASGGFAIFMFFGCLAATKGTALLTKKIVVGIKRCLVRKEEA